MKKVLPFLILFIKVNIAFSQNSISDNWQGVFEGKRFVFRFANESSFLDTPDEGWMNVPVSTLKKDSVSLNLELPYIGSSYKGEFINENKIEGTFNYQGNKFRLNLEPISSIPRIPKSLFKKKENSASQKLANTTLVDVNIIPAQLKAIIDEARSHEYLHSLLIIKNGKIVSENYFGDLDENTCFNIKSINKSILSALIGIAIENGFLKSVDERVLDILSDITIENGVLLKKEITIKHLLTMHSGLDYSENSYPFGSDPVFNSQDWVSATLNLPLKNKPGTIKNYATPNTHLLSAILTKCTKMSTLEFANKYLFAPLGIEGVYWSKDPQGINFGGSEMHLSSTDLAKFGLLYLNNGKYNEQQIITEDWIKESLQNYVVKENIKWYETYGYLWYPRQFGKYSTYQAAGVGGQFIIIVPKHELIIVTTANANCMVGTTENERNLSDFIVNKVIPASINE
jgi:CubicO group peptidase (beta-lactamase class C family)